MRFRGAVVATLAAVVLAGCGNIGVTAAPPPASSAAQSGPDLRAPRAAAGIPDCPVLPDAAPVKGGMPDLVLECLGGGPGARVSALRGPMIVNFWAQWCGPCRLESPYLREFSQAAAGKVGVLGIDTSDPQPELAIEFAGLVGWRYPQLVDLDKTVSAALGLPGLPVTLFIDANGVVVHKHPGAFESTDQLRTLVAQQLGVTV